MLNVNLRLKGVTESKEAEHSTLLYNKTTKKCEAKGKTAALQMVQCDCSSILAIM